MGCFVRWGGRAEHASSKHLLRGTGEDELLRYFSGTGIYKKTIDVKKATGEELARFGLVEVIATVLVNGKVATEWKPPFCSVSA